MRKLLASTIPLLVLASSSFGAAKTTRTAPDYSAFRRKLAADDQILQAVNRLTFGPRPGDVEEIRKLGVKKWVDLQLHPERIPENPVLASKLEPLESLRLTQADAARNYPNPQLSLIHI